MNRFTLIVYLLIVVTSSKVLALNDPFIGVRMGWLVALDKSYDKRAPNSFLTELYLGDSFFENINIELGHQFIDTLHANHTSVDVDYKQFRILTAYKVPVSNTVEAYAGLGGTHWQLKKNRT